MAALQIALYSAWNDAVGVDDASVLDDATTWDEELDGKQMVKYLMNTVETTAYYEGGGVFEGLPVDLSKCGEIQSSAFSWIEDKPVGTTVDLEISLSPDNGSSWGDWVPTVNGGSLPGIASGMDLSGYRVKYRAKLSTTDLAVTPRITQIKLTINSRKLFRILSNGTVKAKAEIMPTVVELL